MRKQIVSAWCVAAVLIIGVESAHAQPGWVLSHQKISETEGGFTGGLNYYDHFGFSAASLGDFDGDGVNDLAVGAPNDGEGAVWLLYLNADGTVKSQQKILNLKAESTPPTSVLHDWFGFTVAVIGDLNRDGVIDLAVGTILDNDGGTNRGAVWILFMDANGAVKARQKISDTEGGFTGALEDEDRFGSVTALGDLDGDGHGDLAVGAYHGDGAVWVLFLNADGTVKSHQKISATEYSWFGRAVASIGDLDGDGVGDLAVGAPNARGSGVLWVLFLNADGTVKAQQQISDTEGGFTGALRDGADFGSSIATMGDLDGDGVTDLAVGAQQDSGHGAVWVLLLNTDGTVKAQHKISENAGGFQGKLDEEDRFAVSVAAIGDLNGDGFGDLAVGAAGDDDGGAGESDELGAVWILFLAGAAGCHDLNGDDAVGPADLAIILGNWGPVPPNDPIADLTGDGVVDSADLAIILANWGPCT